MSSSEYLPAPVRHPAPFGPLPPRARITFVWATPLLMLGLLVIANIAATPLAVPYVIALAQGQETPAWAAALMVLGIVMSFLAFGGAAWFWTRVFERRGAATIGFRRSPLLYLRGLAAGALLAVALLGLSALFAPDQMADVTVGLGLLWNDGSGLGFLAVLFAVFVVQTGAEEVACRGWWLSAVAVRRGALVAVAVSSIGFALLHLHYMLFAPLTGALVLGGVALIGVVLAFYALAERSIWGPCGVHCAYNYVVMVTGVGAALYEQPDQTPFDVAMQALTDITSVTEYDPSLPATLLLLGILSIVTWTIWRRAAKRRDTVLLAD